MNERVKLIRKQLGMTQEQLAQRLGIGKAALSMIETGKAGLSARNRNILVQELNVNPEWLESGKGNMFNAEPDLTAYMHRTDNSLPLQSVPLYSIEGTAGLVPLFADQAQAKPVNFIHIPNLPKCDGAIYIVGDSMYPLLKSGEIRPRGVCETREPEPAPRRQGRGDQPHKGNRAGQGQHQDELDPVAARTGRPYARISRETIPAAAPRCPPQTRCRTLYCKNGTAEAGRAEPAAGNLPQKKMNRHPDSEKISYLSENKTA